MGKLSEKRLDELRDKTVNLLLEMRAAYLANGANALKHWDQIHDRMRAAARTTTTVEEWTSAMLRGLQLSAPSSSISSRAVELSDDVVAQGAKTAWLDLLEREHAYLIAMARLEAEDRKKTKEEGGQ